MNEANLQNEGQFIISTLITQVPGNNLVDQALAEDRTNEGNDNVIEINGSYYYKDKIRCDLCNLKIGCDNYVVHDGHIFDNSCYKYLYAPRCFVCSGIFNKSVIKACGKLYHPECFYCIKCMKVIKTSETHMNVNGFPVCSHCYQLSQNVCMRCLSVVDKKNSMEFYFQGKAYHTHNDHAICSECGKELNPDNFAVLENTQICKKCWYLALRNQCKKCKKPILTSEILKCHGLWHSRCFKCFRCNADVAGCNEVLIDNDEIFCSNCKKSLKTHCAICSKLIGKDFIEKNLRVIHKGCLICSVCKVNLTQNDDSILLGGKLYCCYCLPNN